MCLSFHDLVFVHFVFTLACLFVYNREQQRVVFKKRANESSVAHSSERERFPKANNETKVIRPLRILKTPEISKRGITEKKKTKKTKKKKKKKNAYRWLARARKTPWISVSSAAPVGRHRGRRVFHLPTTFFILHGCDVFSKRSSLWRFLVLLLVDAFD